MEIGGRRGRDKASAGLGLTVDTLLRFKVNERGEGGVRRGKEERGKRSLIDVFMDEASPNG